MILSPLLLYIGVVLALTFAEYSQDRRAQYLFKPLSAFGFLLLALYYGALETSYGMVILCGLLLCALGDLLLLPRDKPKIFTAGVSAFAFGHLLYGLAFMQGGFSALGLGLGLLSFLLLAVIFYFFIWPDIPKDMRVSVVTYVGIIGIMVLGAAIFAHNSNAWTVFGAAIAFAISDVFVAKDRFKARKKWHAFIITPLYFGAQALFAYSVNLQL